MTPDNQQQAKRVVVWRKSWLPESETFIRSQIAAYTRWSARCHGVFRVQHGLSDARDTVFFSAEPSRWMRRRLPAAVLGRLSVLRAKFRDHPQVFHVHFLPDAVNTVRLAHILGMRTVITVHGYDVSSWPTPTSGPRFMHAALRRYRRSVIRRTLASADAVIAVSEPIRSAAIQLGAPPERTQVLHIGVPIREERNDNNSTTREGVLFVGRLVPKKGLEHLLRAWAKLSPELANTPLTILGDGPMRQDLVSLAEHLEVGVEFKGNVPPSEVRATMGRSALLVVPSVTAANGDMEGLPTVVVEAAASGLPIVGFDHSGISEAIPDERHGRVVPEGDVEALAAAMADLLARPMLRADMAAREEDFVRSYFDINRCTSKLEDIYDALLPRNESEVDE